jgi:DNA-binding NarL/FixJ family response regulator
VVTVGERRVVIIDDDLWVRRGRAAALGEVSGVRVMATFSHRDAMAYEGWEDVDVAIVDAWDETEAFDRFPGVRVVQTIRARRSPAETLIIVVSGHVFDDMLRLRLAEAGADFFYGHGEVRDVDTLAGAILRPNDARRVTPSGRERLAEVGLTPGSHPNAALDHITQAGLTAAFEPGRSQKELPVSRRGIITARRRMGELARLAPPRAAGPARRRTAPEWRAIVRFVNWARGMEEREPPPSRQ